MMGYFMIDGFFGTALDRDTLFSSTFLKFTYGFGLLFAVLYFFIFFCCRYLFVVVSVLYALCIFARVVLLVSILSSLCLDSHGPLSEKECNIRSMKAPHLANMPVRSH
ncbi:hypothetical protein K505DRAFT_64285 [Melanomma pulvis-pyrius CBS 109.77]|uniref:Uncharacterized protein n=1 Tax=Melanomma pulvis-pyrius CBS 109.77 TaxID=1314802 RepID=A0A6A6X646_9PLEO|nr:hypothetical protein K505DRAFT_64285 [Melanomma pulvis-pyrius CBS 109.77]